ncbi:MAG: IPExxxVDY family protein [Bacteroidota bacterium]
MKPVKIKIDNNLNFDFFLVGIVCTDNDYKLSWKLNQLLKLDLVKHDSLEIESEKHPLNLVFSFYFYENEDEIKQFALFSNKCSDGLLIEEYKNADFIFKISGDTDQTGVEEIVSQIKTLQDISMVFHIPNKNLKQKTLTRFLF